MFLNIFKHLLPNARAWRLIIDKQLRQFFDGLTAPLGDDSKAFFDNVFSDIDPQQTRELNAWESQFGLSNTITVEQDRRDRLSATWKALGGQSPRYIQDTLQAAGFDVYVHEWWVPGTEAAVGVKACATARDPFLYLTGGTVVRYLSSDGAADMQDGDGLAMDGAIDPTIIGQKFLSCDGNADMQDGDIANAMDGVTTLPTGYPLVNKLLIPESSIIGDGGALMQDGGFNAMDGGILINYFEKEYILPLDVAKYPYFLYIGGQTFPDHANVLQSRRNEFETLCLKICPAQQWLGILVDYS